MLELHAFPIGTHDFLDCRPRDREMLARNRYRQRRNDRQGKRNSKGHSRAFAEPAVDLDDSTNPLDV